jgi:hypothetical protein
MGHLVAEARHYKERHALPTASSLVMTAKLDYLDELDEAKLCISLRLTLPRLGASFLLWALSHFLSFCREKYLAAEREGTWWRAYCTGQRNVSL